MRYLRKIAVRKRGIHTFESVRCKVFLGFTSNLISSGVRDIIRYLVQHHMVDVIVTTTGGVEEDLIKCLAPTFKADFSLPGAQLRSKRLNRIGNLLVPNDNYCKFEDWIIPIFDKMLEEQNSEKIIWTPSKLINRLGKEINDESSYIYWAHKNNIPIFFPGLTDGSLGDMLYFHSFRNPGLIIDIVQDIRAMNGEAVHAAPRKTSMIILGGGLPKHHICNANMMRMVLIMLFSSTLPRSLMGVILVLALMRLFLGVKFEDLQRPSRCIVILLLPSLSWLRRHLPRKKRQRAGKKLKAVQ